MTESLIQEIQKSTEKSSFGDLFFFTEQQTAKEDDIKKTLMY